MGWLLRRVPAGMSGPGCIADPRTRKRRHLSTITASSLGFPACPRSHGGTPSWGRGGLFFSIASPSWLVVRAKTGEPVQSLIPVIAKGCAKKAGAGSSYDDHPLRPGPLCPSRHR